MAGERSIKYAAAVRAVETGVTLGVQTSAAEGLLPSQREELRKAILEQVMWGLDRIRERGEEDPLTQMMTRAAPDGQTVVGVEPWNTAQRHMPIEAWLDFIGATFGPDERERVVAVLLAEPARNRDGLVPPPPGPQLPPLEPS